jgi:hypothetical protein
MPLHGLSLTKVTARGGRCAGRCGAETTVVLLIRGDGTYVLPSAQPESCASGQTVVVPDEIGTIVLGRHGKDLLQPTNRDAVVAAVAACRGTTIRARPSIQWIRRTAGVVVEGRLSSTFDERGTGGKFHVRQLLNVADPARKVAPPPGYTRAPQCNGTISLRCRG